MCQPIFKIADYFILQSDGSSGDTMTHLRLQKLVYYAQAWYVAINKKPLIADRVEAWAHGPVFPSLWEKYKGYGSRSLPLPTSIRIDRRITSFLDDIWRVYGQYSAKRLEEITHNEEPWTRARGRLPVYAACNTEISLRSMFNFYSPQLKHE